MHSHQLRERIRLMRARLDNAAPVAEIRAESQLFVSPAPIWRSPGDAGGDQLNRDHILEPCLPAPGPCCGRFRDTAPEAML